MLKTSALLATAIFVLCDSAAIIETDKRCSVNDEDCLRSLFGILVNIIADNGNAEVGIPKSDPYILKDFNIQPLGMLNINLTDGAVKGFRSCYSTSYKNNVEAGLAKIEIMCDHFGIEVNYIAESTPTLSALIGDINIHGKGTGSAVVEKLKVNVDLAFEVIKHDDGEVYFNLKLEDCSYTFDVLGKLTVAGNNFYVGKQDISAVLVNIINEYWKFFINTFGQTLSDEAFNVIYLYVDKFFKNVPAKELIIDELMT